MKRVYSIIIIFTLFLFVSLVSKAQTASGVVCRQDGQTIVVNYSLDKFSTKVDLYVSTDGGKKFAGPLRCVSGDVTNVESGQKTIRWDVLSEYDSLSGNDIVFEVRPQKMDNRAQGEVNVKSLSKPKKVKFEFEFGVLGDYQWKKVTRYSYSSKNHYQVYQGFGFSIPASIGISIKDKHYVGAFQDFRMIPTENTYNGSIYSKSLDIDFFWGLEYRYIISMNKNRASKLWLGIRGGFDSVQLSASVDSPPIVAQAQIGYAPLKWLSINANLGYPDIQFGVTLNVPNMFRK